MTRSADESTRAASLHAGDTIVQRATVHNWINRTAEPCTITFVLFDAQPLDAAFTRRRLQKVMGLIRPDSPPIQPTTRFAMNGQNEKRSHASANAR